jgi:hypothetical protein
MPGKETLADFMPAALLDSVQTIKSSIGSCLAIYAEKTILQRKG